MYAIKQLHTIQARAKLFKELIITLFAYKSLSYLGK